MAKTPPKKSPKKKLAVKRRPITELPDRDLERVQGGGSLKRGLSDSEKSIYTSTILDTTSASIDV